MVVPGEEGAGRFLLAAVLRIDGFSEGFLQLGTLVGGEIRGVEEADEIALGHRSNPMPWRPLDLRP